MNYSENPPQSQREFQYENVWYKVGDRIKMKLDVCHSFLFWNYWRKETKVVVLDFIGCDGVMVVSDNKRSYSIIGSIRYINN